MKRINPYAITTIFIGIVAIVRSLQNRKKEKGQDEDDEQTESNMSEAKTYNFLLLGEKGAGKRFIQKAWEKYNCKKVKFFLESEIEGEQIDVVWGVVDWSLPHKVRFKQFIKWSEIIKTMVVPKKMIISSKADLPPPRVNKKKIEEMCSYLNDTYGIHRMSISPKTDYQFLQAIAVCVGAVSGDYTDISDW